ncbi:MAG: hypothetical protein CMI96_04150 [Pelagibacteraceae bacterium]|nr:hypothetical protein [Pelagibacteraceae bacterium]|tara:strand:+ start:11361 stop:12725 length:1365 start_codon:yes stop_codon:yes gene_type:complete
MNLLNKIKYFEINFIISFMISSIPILLITGPFLPDLALSIVCLIFLCNIFYKKKYKLLYNKFILLSLLWCSYLLLRSLFSQHIYLSFESSLFFFRFFLLSYIIYYLLNNYNPFVKNFFYTMFFCFFVLIVDGFIQFIFGYNLIGIPYNENRISSFFNTEYILGSYLSHLYPLLVAGIFIIYSSNKKIIYISFLLYIFIDVLIFLSGERKAFFNMFLSGLIFITLFNDFKIVRLFSIIISIFLIFIIVKNFEQPMQRMITQTVYDLNINPTEQVNNNLEVNTDSDNFIETKNKSNKSIENKIYIFSKQHHAHFITASNIFTQNIIFGVGPKLFRIYCHDEKYKYVIEHDLTSIDGCSTHPHNFFLQLLSETGLIGFIPILFVFVLVSYLFIKQFIKLYFLKSFYLSNVQLSLLSCVAIYLWPIAPSGNFFGNWLSIVGFLPLGFILFYFNLIKND